MFITFYKNIKAAQPQITFDDILANPYQEINTTPIEPEWLKLTTKIPEHVGKTMFDKRFPDNINSKVAHIPSIPEPDKEYYSFRIPKRRDPSKWRSIDAPNPELKMEQTLIKQAIEDTLKILPHDAAHAYTKKRSTATCLKVHQDYESKWFLGLDIEEFFPSHNAEYINRMMDLIYPFKFIPQEIKDKWIKSALLDNKIPQGSSLSPTLTNILMVPIDHAIFTYLSKRQEGFRYTRYADDLIISSKYKFNPDHIETAIKNIFKQFNTPFKLNEEKSRFGSSSGKNWNLGIMLNKENKITIGHENNQRMRAMINNFLVDNFTLNNHWSLIEIQQMTGKIAYYKSIQPDYTNHVLKKYSSKYNSTWDILIKEAMNRTI